MKKILNIIVVPLILLINSCIGRYAAPELVEGTKRTPEDDYLKLKAFFEQKGGKLESKDDTRVKWIDTKIYRIYIFKHHTVAIFPFNWNEKQFDMYLFAGHLKKYDNLLKDIYFTFHYDETKQSSYDVNETMNLTGRYTGVKLDDFKLGMNAGKAKELAARKFYDYFRADGTSKEKAKEMTESYSKYHWPIFENFLQGSSTNFEHFTLRFVGNKLVWMEFISKGMPMIAHYGLAHREKLGIVAQGEFKLPAKITLKTKTDAGEEF